MNSAILSITAPFFLVGALLTALANRAVTVAGRRRHWIKFLVYVVIVHFVLGAAALGQPYLLGLVASILALAGFELGRALSRITAPIAIYAAVLATYVVLAGAFIVGTLGFSSTLFAFLYLLVVAFDGFSELSGRLFGGKKLVPSLSPGKTVEGAVGGAVGALVMALFARSLVQLTPVQALAFGAAVSITALLGDLAASWFKRKVGIKDFGTLVPGHGGVLDRFDSLIGTGAMTGLVFCVVSPWGK